jgi:hypothetical protein
VVTRLTIDRGEYARRFADAEFRRFSTAAECLSLELDEESSELSRRFGGHSVAPSRAGQSFRVGR